MKIKTTFFYLILLVFSRKPNYILAHENHFHDIQECNKNICIEKKLKKKKYSGTISLEVIPFKYQD